MHAQRARRELAIADQAAQQHGVVSSRQLAQAGLGKDAIRHRVLSGRLFPVHRGIYSVGHPVVSREGKWWAALLACGDSAVLSHRTAAALWELLPHSNGLVDVALPSRNGRRQRRGFRVHRPLSLPLADRTRRHGIPVTTPARTIADLRRGTATAQLRRAIREAEAKGLWIGPDHQPDKTRSELEVLFLRLCRRLRLPAPEVNARVGRWQVDFFWRDKALIVETDGYRFHHGRTAFEDDRDRGLELRALGYEVIRLSHRQVVDEPEATGATLVRIFCRAQDSPPTRESAPPPPRVEGGG